MLDRVGESVLDRNLKYLASELSGYGIESGHELKQAVERAMQVCQSAELSVRSNFKAIYVCIEGQLYKDWRLSELGRNLILLNASPANPYVARLQLELLKRV